MLQKVNLRTLNEKTGRAEIEIHELDPAMRSKRALKVAGIGFGITLFCVLIPGLHFILVPAGLIATPIVAWITYGKTALVQTTGIPCPSCGKEFRLATQPPRFPLRETCEHCHQEVTLTPATGA